MEPYKPASDVRIEIVETVMEYVIGRDLAPVPTHVLHGYQ